MSKLASMAIQGRVYGLDHSKESVAVAKRTNKKWIDIAHVEIREGSVSHLPFSDSEFDLVTAVETHFWWPNLPADLCQVLRVLKPSGRLIIIAEVYKGAQTFAARAAEKYSALSGMALLSVDEHRQLFMNAGYFDVKVITEPSKGWICAIGTKPSLSQLSHTVQ